MTRQTAGEPGHKSADRTIGRFVSAVSLPAFYGRILSAKAWAFAPNQIIELGTGSGISTLYLALALPNQPLTSIDAHPQATMLAHDCCIHAQVKNVRLHTSTFNAYLQSVKDTSFGRLMILLDGDHGYEATLQYFDIATQLKATSLLIVIDDIDWSPTMLQAWQDLRHRHPRYRFTSWFRMGMAEWTSPPCNS